MRDRRLIRRTLGIFLLCAFVTASHAIAGRRIALLPQHGVPVTVVNNGKESTYFLLTTKSPIRVEVDGPGTLAIRSRLVFPRAGNASGGYTLSVVEGSKLLKSNATQTQSSELRVKSSGAVLGKTRKCTVDLADGLHTYEIRLEKSDMSEAALQLTFVPARGAGGKRVTLEALSYDRVVTARVKEKLITYYVGSTTRKVQLRVIGPTSLSISARLTFDDRLKGDQRYAVVVWEGDRKVMTNPFSTTKALGAGYEEWKDVVPGKVNTFLLEVPKGQHTYKLDFEQTLARFVAFKFSIPQKDLDNEN
jgi:hypothetical protein